MKRGALLPMKEVTDLTLLSLSIIDSSESTTARVSSKPLPASRLTSRAKKSLSASGIICTVSLENMNSPKRTLPAPRARVSP